MSFKLKTLLQATIAISVIMTTVAHAQDGYPNRPIRLVVGLSAGASSDTVAREIAKGLTEQLKVSVVVITPPWVTGRLACPWSNRAIRRAPSLAGMC